MSKVESTKKRVSVDIPLSMWSWCRERSVEMGIRGVKGYLESLLATSKKQWDDGGGRISGEGGDIFEDAGTLTRRELTEKKEELIDQWVLDQLNDAKKLDALPQQTKASLISARLPKMGVSRGEMEEKALSLRAALKDISSYEDIQGEMVTLREEVMRLRGEVERLEAEIEVAASDGTLDEKVVAFWDLCRGWREGIKDALLGREAAERCMMLRKDKLDEVWNKGAMEIAGIAVDLSLVTHTQKVELTKS